MRKLFWGIVYLVMAILTIVPFIPETILTASVAAAARHSFPIAGLLFLIAFGVSLVQMSCERFLIDQGSRRAARWHATDPATSKWRFIRAIARWWPFQKVRWAYVAARRWLRRAVIRVLWQCRRTSRRGPVGQYAVLLFAGLFPLISLRFIGVALWRASRIRWGGWILGVCTLIRLIFVREMIDFLVWLYLAIVRLVTAL